MSSSWWFVLLCVRAKLQIVVGLPSEGTPGRLILANELGLQVGFHLYILVSYNMESLSELVWYVWLACQVVFTSQAHTLGWSGPTVRSTGLLTNQTHLSGTTETLVRGDP
jgi:hypothetical protein